MEARDASDARALNRARWDALAAVDGQDAVYDTEALVAGRDSLTEEEGRGAGGEEIVGP